MSEPRTPGAVSPLVDLAAERFGGRALLANDEFFAPKENLLKPGRGVFIEDKYTDRGKWMDGWETRRRREPGHDWCLVRLGLPGQIRRVVVDTNHFRGNYPEACSLEAIAADPDEDPEALVTAAGWVEVLPRSTLEGHAENELEVEERGRFTHVRLNIFPDGGVARLRVLGEVLPDWTAVIGAGEAVDLLSVQNGGVPLACSDRFFSEPLNLIRPDIAQNMGDGWETLRRRGPGNDWLILRLGRRGTLDEVEVDTRHFKGNYPESCSLEGCDAPGASLANLTDDSTEWFEVLPRAKLGPDAQVRFSDLGARGPMTHVRFNIYPDGGVSRLRLFGRPTDGSG